MVQLRQLRPALARSNLRGTLGSVSQQCSPTVPTTQPQWPHKRVSVSPELCPEQWPRSPSTSIITPSTQHGTMRPIGWSGIPKPPAVDTDGPRSRRPNAGLTPRHHPPLPSMTPLPLCSKSTVSIQPKPILTPALSIKACFVAGCEIIRDTKW